MKNIKSEIDRLITLLNQTKDYDIKSSEDAYNKLEKIFPNLWLNIGNRTDSKIAFCIDVLKYLRKILD